MGGVTVGLVWAQGRNGEIGAHGALPWSVPEDLARFAALTRGRPVIMGRRTWESLPARNRPLPGRANIVLTRQDGWSASGAHVAPSLRAGIELARELARAEATAGEAAASGAALRAVEDAPLARKPARFVDDRPAVWVIGGASVYQVALDEGWADLVEATEVDMDVPDADAFAPALDSAVWTRVASGPWSTSESGVRYRFCSYRRA